jgi:hypothetical protein
MGKRLLKCENFALIAVKPSEIAEVVNIFGLSQAVLTEDLAFMHIAAKFVPQLLRRSLGASKFVRNSDVR